MWYLKPNENIIDIWFKDVFTFSELDLINKLGSELNPEKATIRKKGLEMVVDYNTRITDISWLKPNDKTEWIYQKLTELILVVNERCYKYDLTYLEDLQFTVYNEGHFCNKHIDSASNINLHSPRKLSFTLQLSDPQEYEGGDVILLTSNEPRKIKKERGIITFFPSNTLHEVTTVTKGIRKSLVGWVHGPNWK